MNLLHLETFLIVCKNGNFTEAAKQLYLPQPTISNRISYLEEEMGQDLFIRGEKGKRCAELTRSGKAFYPYAQLVIETINIAKNELNQDVNEKLITIGSSVALTHPYICEKINLLNNVHKNINLLIMDHTLITKSLIDGVIDMAFVMESIITKELKSFPVYSEKVELIVSSNHPLSRKKQLDNLTDLEQEYAVFYKPIFKDITDINRIKYKKRVITNQIELVTHLITNHNGISFLPSSYFEAEIKKGTLVHIPILNEILSKEIQYYLVSRRSEMFYKDIFYLYPRGITNQFNDC